MTREDLINQRATTCRHGGHCEWVACDKCNHYEPDSLNQQPCEDCISRKSAIDAMIKLEQDDIECYGCAIPEGFNSTPAIEALNSLPSVTPKEKTGHCKYCKYFEYDSVAKVNGIPLIVAHEICSRWGDGCKTKENGYCFLFEPQESDG